MTDAIMMIFGGCPILVILLGVFASDQRVPLYYTGFGWLMLGLPIITYMFYLSWEWEYIRPCAKTDGKLINDGMRQSALWITGVGLMVLELLVLALGLIMTLGVVTWGVLCIVLSLMMSLALMHGIVSYRQAKGQAQNCPAQTVLGT